MLSASPPVPFNGIVKNTFKLHPLVSVTSIKYVPANNDEIVNESAVCVVDAVV